MRDSQSDRRGAVNTGTTLPAVRTGKLSGPCDPPHALPSEAAAAVAAAHSLLPVGFSRAVTGLQPRRQLATAFRRSTGAENALTYIIDSLLRLYGSMLCKRLQLARACAESSRVL